MGTYRGHHQFQGPHRLWGRTGIIISLRGRTDCGDVQGPSSVSGAAQTVGTYRGHHQFKGPHRLWGRTGGIISFRGRTDCGDVQGSSLV